MSPDTPDMSAHTSMSSETPTPEISPSSSVPPLPVSASTPDPARPTPAFGWSAYAEQLNGRFAMIGFVALLILEFFTHQDFFTWLGLR
ncbi:chlorophyll a/b-binding protein [Trichothermofontia sichuanensis]|uniref:chlorophyll a/b-binding protein n=1 Tax=Trichothermofontia sichuanensis TaxID=3045816 RepID=UPI0036F28278